MDEIRPIGFADGPESGSASQELEIPPTTDPATLRGELAAEFEEGIYKAIVREFEMFLDRRLAKVRCVVDVKKPDVSMNPFLLLASSPAYNLYSPYEIADFIQMAKFTHGDTTAFGNLLDGKLLELFGLVKPREKKNDRTLFSPIDRELTVAGRRYLLSIKSGPNGMNQDHAHQMIAKFPDIKKKTGCDLIICIAYTTRGRVNNKPGFVVRNTGDFVHVLVGRSFWEFVTGVKEAHLKIFRAIREAQHRFALKHKEETFFEQKVSARLQLAKSLRDAFGLLDESEDDMWEKIFKNSF